MRIEIGDHPQEHAFSGSGLAGNRDTFAGPKRKIDRPQMKPTQCMAFEHAEELSFRVIGPIFCGNSPDEFRPDEKCSHGLDYWEAQTRGIDATGRCRNQRAVGSAAK